MKTVTGLFSQFQRKFGIANDSRAPAPISNLGCTALIALTRDSSIQTALPWFHEPEPPLSYTEVARRVLAACELAASQGATVCQAVRSKRCSSQRLPSVLRIWFQGPASWSWRPSPAWLTPCYLQTFASLIWFSLKSPPPGETLGMNVPPKQIWWKATMDLSPTSSFSTSLPKNSLLLAWSPTWPHNSRYRRHPLLQDFPNYTPKHEDPKDRSAPLCLCTAPPLPSNQHPALTSQRSWSSSEGKGQTWGHQISHHLCIPQRES